MIKEPSLWNAICENPEDDTLRLVYADWLEEHGELDRADLIRVQIECSRQELPDADWTDAAFREQELLRKIGDRWQDELPQLPGICWSGLERGFPCCAETSDAAAFANAGEVIRTQTPVRSLAFHTLEPKQNWVQDPNNPNLSRLRISNSKCQQQVEDLFQSPQLQQLNCLNLARTPLQHRLGSHGARLLSECPYLSQLTELNLQSQSIGDDGVAALAQSPYLGNLTLLVLQGNALGPESLLSLANSPYLKNLRYLDLHGEHFEDGGMHSFDADSIAAFVNSPNAAYLHTLFFGSWTDLPPDAADALLEGSHLQQLRTLALAGFGNHLGTDHVDVRVAQSLVNSTILSGLMDLQLFSIPIGSEGLKLLSSAPASKNLHRLSVTLANVDAEGFQAVAQSPHLQKLEALELDIDLAGDAGLDALARSPYLHNLRVLQLFGGWYENQPAPYTKEAVQRLKESPQLKSLVHVVLPTPWPCS